MISFIETIFFFIFPDDSRAVLTQFVWAVYKDRQSDQRGKEIVAELARRLSGNAPSNKREWIVFYKKNLVLTKELAPRIQNPILRRALVDRNRDTEKLLRKLESGAGTKRDVEAYNARTIQKLKQALEEYRKGGQNDEE